MVRTKVFVGNLSFKTREAELSQVFEPVAKVVSVNIITRGPRSLGYGFVELENEEDAKKAVAAMDKKEIDGRPINVEVAKVRAEPAEGAEASPKPEGARPPRRPRAPRDPNAAPRDPNAAAPAPRENAPRDPNAAPRNPRGPRRPRAEKPEGGDAAAASASPKAEKPAGSRPPRGPRTRKPANAAGAAASPKADKPAGEASPAAPREKRAPRPKRDPTQPDNRESSKDSLFVANLPFTLTNESFGKIFTDAGLKFKKAHVVTKRNQKSKGFGFVEFDNEEDQKKALNTLQGKKIEERELAIKVALVEPPKKSEEKAAASPAPTPASPAPAAKTN